MVEYYSAIKKNEIRPFAATIATKPPPPQCLKR